MASANPDGRNARIIVTADTDFGALLAARGTSSPSVVMLRSSDHLTPDEQARLVAVVLTHVGDELEDDAIASVTPERIRLRSLPIAPDSAPTLSDSTGNQRPVSLPGKAVEHGLG